jgi:type I restriction enzyme, S subunit
MPLILKRFRQAVLAAATSGQLTEDWRSSANEFEARSDQLQCVDVIPLEYESDDTPETWYWAKLGDLVINHDNRRVPVKATDRAKRHGPYPYYGAFGIIDKIDEFLYDGDFLLIAEDGKNLESRQRPIALLANGKFWVNNHAHVLQQKDGMQLAYLNLYLNSPSLDLTLFLTGIDQVKLTRSAMDRIPVSVPSIEEQQEIIRRVETLFTFADRLEARYKMARAQVEQLTPALLAKAFCGELVPQDSNDEPAAVLLERILAARVVAKGNGAKPQRRKTDKSSKVESIVSKRKEEQPSHLPDVLTTRDLLTAEALFSASQLELNIDDSAV